MQTQTTILRLSNPNDLWTLENRFLAAIGEPPLDAAAQQRLLQAIHEERIVFFLAKRGDQSIGLCSVSPHFSTFACGTVGVFDDFYVEPAFRRQGIARQLTAAAQDWCRAQGYASLTVGCSDGDIAMYRALGFETRLGTMLATD